MHLLKGTQKEKTEANFMSSAGPGTFLIYPPPISLIYSGVNLFLPMILPIP